MQKFLFINSNDKDLEEVFGKVKALNGKAGPFELVLNINPLTKNVPDAIAFSDLKRAYLMKYLKPKKTTDIHEVETNVSKSYKTLEDAFGVFEINENCKIGYINFQAKLDPKKCISYFESLHGLLNILVVVNSTFENIGTVDSILKFKKPHYVIRTGEQHINDGEFLEEQPFVWENSTINRITREIYIPQFNKGKKWAYAFNYDPTKELKIPAQVRNNPYSGIVKSRKRKLETVDEAEALERLKQKILKLKSINPSKCHFCFTNEDIQDHMIISISDSVYLTVAKGPLCVPQNGLLFPGHCIITSIEHLPKLNSSIKSFTDLHESPLYLDMCKFEQSLVKMFSKFDMCIVTFEINSINSVHYHTQVFPVPLKFLGKVEVAIERQVKYNNTKFQDSNGQLEIMKFKNDKEEAYLEVVNDPNSNYFQFKVFNTRGNFEIYLIKIDPNKRLDLQFGRRALAYVLNQPKRVLWNSPACLETTEKETKNVELFQKEYKEFDFTS